MKKITFVKLFLAMFLLGGCETGPRIHKLDEPKQPFGANVEINVPQTDTSRTLPYEGELIEVTDDGLLLALRMKGGEPPVTFVPWSRIHSVEATKLPGYKSIRTSSGSHNPRSTEKMRLVSRFPQGLSPELKAKLLASFDQDTAGSLP